MTRFVYSADGVAFTRYDDPPPSAGRDPILLNTGPQTVYLPSVPTGTTLGTAGQQGWSIYPIIDSPVQCTPASYYEPEPAGYSWLLDGPLLGTTTSAIETRECVGVSMDELRRAKEIELVQYSSVVYNSAFSHSAGGTDFWAKNDLLPLTARNIYGSYLGMRGLDALFDAVDAGIDAGGGTNNEVAIFWSTLKSIQQSDPWWDRDVKVFLYYQSTLQLVRSNATSNQWRDLMRSAGTFAWQIRNAQDRVQTDIELYYGQGESGRASLQAIDVADATYNWPDHYTGPLPG